MLVVVGLLHSLWYEKFHGEIVHVLQFNTYSLVDSKIAVEIPRIFTLPNRTTVQTFLSLHNPTDWFGSDLVNS